MNSDFGTLIPSNFVPWLLHTFTCYNIDIDYSNLDGEHFPMLHAEQMNLKPSINLSSRTGSKNDVLDAGSAGDTRVFVWLEGFRVKASSKAIVKSKPAVHEC